MTTRNQEGGTFREGDDVTFKARGLYASSSKEPRRSRRGLWLLLGAALTVTVIVVTLFSVVGNLPVHRSDQSDSFTGVEALELNNNTGGEVRFSGGGDELTLDRSMRGSPFKDPGDTVTERGDTLGVDTRCGGAPIPFGTCSVDYDVTVPEGTEVSVETISGEVVAENVAGAVSVTTTSGDVTVNDNVGDVTVESSSGEVEVADVAGAAELGTTSGDITASGEGSLLTAGSSSGTVDLTEFTAETVSAETTSGSVSVGEFTDAEISSASGDVQVDTGEPFEQLLLETTSGSMEVRVPDEAYQVTGESTSGSRDIEVDTSPDAETLIHAESTSGSLLVER